jgi:integral membrane protein (TIGR01906 family)
MTNIAQEQSRSEKHKWLSWLVTILVPLALILTATRFLMTPAFVQLEYRTPNFPPDRYGFTREDRLFWSMIALDYLLNDEDISFLGELQFDDGSQVYNTRELKHMVDVKNAVQVVLIVWYISLIGILLLGLWAWWGGWWQEYKRGLVQGGWLTVILVGVTMIAVLIGFGVFFVFFHEIFFETGTWVFRFSDTLIRLFPERFWRDAFLAIGILTLGGALALIFGFREKSSDAK